MQQSREFDGVVLDWASGQHATDYDLDASNDGVTWHTLRAVRGGNGGRDFLHTPESEALHLRVRILRSADRRVALREIALQPLGWAPDRTAFFAAVAREAAHKGSRQGQY